MSGDFLEDDDDDIYVDGNDQDHEAAEAEVTRVERPSQPPASTKPRTKVLRVGSEFLSLEIKFKDGRVLKVVV